jgi:tRNA U38,U39,U40 pseudouridine synthase TruA
VIYAIHAVGTNFVKFGKANNVKRRLAALQTSNPLELRVLAQADWPDSAEARIHALLRHSSVRGEWFSLDKLAVNLVALMREPDGLDKLEEMGDGLMGQSTLKRLFRLTKEDLGVWRTRDHEATLA